MTASHVCLIAPEFIGPYPNGGVGTACYWEARSLRRAGFRVTVLYTGPTERETPAYWERHFARVEELEFIDLSSWAASTGADAQVSLWEPPFPEGRTSELVLAFLRTRSFDLILAQEFQGHGLRALQARQSGDALVDTPIVVTLHGSRQWTCEGMQRLPIAPDMNVDFLEKESVRLADAVIAPSASMADWVVSRWGVNRPMVVPYCFDEASARESRVVHHRGPFTHLAFFGRLETRKGVQLLVRAIAGSPLLRSRLERVTFLGKHARIEGIPSEQFFADTLPSIAPLEVTIISDKGSHEALAWLKAQERVLAVAPSLGDNLPYTLIEMFTNQIPFVSTRIGGIPEIVGGANQHLLAEATVEGLRSTLEAIVGGAELAIDYRDGYHVTRATQSHVEIVRQIIGRAQPRRESASTSPLRIVVTDATTPELVSAVREQWPADAARADWFSFNEWRRCDTDTMTLFVDRSVKPQPDALARLSRAIGHESDAATAFYSQGTAGAVYRVAPLGGAIDAGWQGNVFGGPCLLAGPAAAAAIRHLNQAVFAFWPAYAAVACSRGRLAVVPADLYRCAPQPVPDVPAIETVARIYHQTRPAALDLRWILKGAFGKVHAASTTAAAVSSAPGDAQPRGGRAIYDRLIAASDAELRGFAELDPAAIESDPYFRDFAAVRQRLTSIVRRFEAEDTRVYIYGAGQHTRMLLAANPALGRFVDGFIDRQSRREFLGKPCVTPDTFRSDMADAIVYSSREWERDMYARMRDVTVEHVMLYTDPLPVPTADTLTRIRNRFGTVATDDAPLREVMSRRPSWLTGAISGGDASFLFHVIHALAPAAVLELGVASGCSTATLLAAMDALPADRPRVLSSFDVLDHCYFDKTRPTGSAALEMHPRPRTEWRLNTRGMDARAIARAYAPGTFDFAFIDANHCHPWPLLDVLHLTTVLAPGSWIVLHDIELPVLHPHCPDRGAQLLFKYWPFDKVHGVADSRNIGAIRLPRDPAQLIELADYLLSYPWQWPVHEAFMELPAEFDSIARKLRAQLEASRATNPVPGLAAI